MEAVLQNFCNVSHAIATVHAKQKAVMGHQTQNNMRSRKLEQQDEGRLLPKGKKKSSCEVKIMKGTT